MNKDNSVKIYEIQNLLFQLYSMGELLINHLRDLRDSDILQHDDDAPCDPILTISDIIKEKSKACLEKLEELEALVEANCLKSGE